MNRDNPKGEQVQIDNTAYVHSTAVIMGKVNIGKNVFVGPLAVIRADEPGSSITIKDNSNIQDRVIIHALENTAVLIEENTSLAHGCIVHGPCKIGKECFIGFGSVVFNAEMGEGVIIKHLAVVEGVNILPERVVESSRAVNNEDEIRKLVRVDESLRNFARKVVKMNSYLVKNYKNKT